MELSSPIIIYWDILPAEDSLGHLLQIWAEISECRPLQVKVTLLEAAVLNDSLTGLLKTMQASGTAVSVTLPMELADSAAALLTTGEFNELLYGCQSLELLKSHLSAKITGVSFSVNYQNWRDIPEMLTVCHDAGVRRVVFAMQRSYFGQAPFFLSASEQGELSDMLQQVPLMDLDITIHDPFLWSAVHPGQPFPQGGCQAANTMIAIGPDGTVYPCPALPVRLGHLGGAQRLREIIASEGKKSLRTLLLKKPALCRDCEKLETCRGGCRGRGFVVYGSFDGMDVACR